MSVCLVVYLSFYLSICISVCLVIYLSIYLSVCISVSVQWYIYLFTNLYVCLSSDIPVFFCLSIFPSVYSSTYVSLYVSLHLCVCMNIYLSVYLCVHQSFIFYFSFVPFGKVSHYDFFSSHFKLFFFSLFLLAKLTILLLHLPLFLSAFCVRLICCVHRLFCPTDTAALTGRFS